jgi:hypothetical protein
MDKKNTSYKASKLSFHCTVCPLTETLAVFFSVFGLIGHGDEELIHQKAKTSPRNVVRSEN